MLLAAKPTRTLQKIQIEMNSWQSLLLAVISLSILLHFSSYHRTIFSGVDLSVHSVIISMDHSIAKRQCHHPLLVRKQSLLFSGLRLLSCPSTSSTRLITGLFMRFFELVGGQKSNQRPGETNSEPPKNTISQSPSKKTAKKTRLA